MQTPSYEIVREVGRRRGARMIGWLRVGGLAVAGAALYALVHWRGFH